MGTREENRAKLLASIAEKQKKAAALRETLDMSLALRKLCNLPMTGQVQVRRIKPSGILPTQPEKFTVAIYHDNKVVKIMVASEFDAYIKEYKQAHGNMKI